MLTFLHAADIHLDIPLHNLDLYEGAPVEGKGVKSTISTCNIIRKIQRSLFYSWRSSPSLQKISKDGKPIVESSTISWSCGETCTNKNPQYDQHNWL